MQQRFGHAGDRQLGEVRPAVGRKHHQAGAQPLRGLRDPELHGASLVPPGTRDLALAGRGEQARRPALGLLPRVVGRADIPVPEVEDRPVS